MKKQLQTFILFLLTIGYLSAQDLQRGPYMQSLTPTSVKIMWRTSEPTVGWVKFGLDPANLESVKSEDATIKDHNVEIVGLDPDKKYYYQIGFNDTPLTGATDDYNFKTSKLAGDTTGFSAWLIGDFGKGNVEQRDTRIAMENYAKVKPIDIGIMLGDNAYSDGTDVEYQTKMFDMPNGYAEIFRNLPFYSTPGNHDYNSVNRLDDPKTHKGPYFEVFEALTKGEAGGIPSNTELYYSFDYGNVHFVNLNSELIQWTGIANSPMEQWLKQDLEANKQHWTVVFYHQPPYSSGSHRSDDFWEIFMRNMRERFNPILEKYSVDLVVCGHSHLYERSFLINGHTGRSPSYDPAKHLIQGGSGNPNLGETYVKTLGGKGTIYNVVGNSGSYEGVDEIPARPLPIFYIRDAGNSVCGSLVLEVKGSLLKGMYLSSTGEIKDTYAIFKQMPTSTPVKENFADKIGLIAYPNPSADYLQISFNGEKSARGSLLVTDISGKQVLSQTIQTNQGVMNYTVNDWKKLAAGTYIIQINFDNQPASISVVKGQ